MKVWVEIVAIDGRRIKTPVREDYEDHRDDDPICTADVVAEGFAYWVQDSYFGVPEHQRAYTRLGRALLRALMACARSAVSLIPETGFTASLSGRAMRSRSRAGGQK